jgi:hypothetical protein
MAETDNTMSATELFDLSLEIEGLLALAVRREDMVPSEVFQLLNDKTLRFAEGIQALVSHAGCPVVTSASSRAAQEREFVASLPSLPGLFDSEAAPDESAPCDEDNAPVSMVVDVSMVAEDQAGYEASDDRDAATDASMNITPMDTAMETPVDAPVETPVATKGEDTHVSEAESHAPDADSGVQTVDAEVSLFAEVPEAPVKAVETARPRHAVHEPGELRRMFTVNDKFRFRRELFGNSDTEFTDTLNLVEAMRNYNEAEDYFYNDLAWDAEASEVQEFMAVVNRYFNK